MWLALVLLALPAPTPGELRGRTLFLTGVSPSGGEVVALVGQDVALPGLACATCHGPDGLGRPEGGVRPADVRWAALERRATAASGRTRPAYDDAALKRAVALGIDSGGTRLDRVMPRYRLSAEDMRDLLAHLRTLGERPDPGVTADALTLGALVPAGPAGPAWRAALAAWAQELNGRGGVFARRVELRFFEPEPAALEALAEDAQPFAFLGGATLDPDDRVGAWMRAAGAPLVRAGRLELGEGTLNPCVFELGAPTREELRALLESAVRAGTATIVVWPAAEAGLAAGLCADGVCRLASDPQAADAVLVLGSDVPPALVRGRIVLVPSVLAADLVPGLAERAADVFVATRVAPEDVSADAARRYALASEGRVEQWSALAAARLLEEALVRAGRELSRPGLLDALESVRDLDTGFGPPLGFDRRRHHGSLLTRVLRVRPDGAAQRATSF